MGKGDEMSGGEREIGNSLGGECSPPGTPGIGLLVM